MKKRKLGLIVFTALLCALAALEGRAAVLSDGTLLDGYYDILDDPVLGEESLARDPQTGLVWRRCSVGQTWVRRDCAGEPKEFQFQEAQVLAEQGWRLPTVRELHSLIYCSKGIGVFFIDVRDGGPKLRNACIGDGWERPTIKSDVFPRTPIYFWSSSGDVGYSMGAYLANFSRGGVGDGSRLHRAAVRLVRASP